MGNKAIILLLLLPLLLQPLMAREVSISIAEHAIRYQLNLIRLNTKKHHLSQVKIDNSHFHTKKPFEKPLTIIFV